MDEVDWNGVFFGLGFLILSTIVLVAVLIQVGAFSRARIARRTEEHFEQLMTSYRALADRSTAHIERASGDLADVRARLASIERLLREVE